MATNMFNAQKDNYQPVAAIITAMTDGEQSFLFETLQAVLLDPYIGQVVLCIEEKNDWIDTVIASLMIDPRLQIVRLPLMPLGAVRNRALNYVQKPWVAYCDGDDVWCEGKTRIQYTFANNMGCDFVGSDHYLMDEEGKIRAFALARYVPMPSSWMVRTEIMRQYPFNEEIYRSEDGEWWARTANLVQKVRCPKMLLRYRVRSNSLSSSSFSKKRKTQIVNLGKIPIFGLSILFLTYCAWLLTRQKQYILPLR
jgi:glycosyltransferase involved in cell wall biosynthesis